MNFNKQHRSCCVTLSAAKGCRDRQRDPSLALRMTGRDRSVEEELSSSFEPCLDKATSCAQDDGMVGPGFGSIDTVVKC